MPLTAEQYYNRIVSTYPDSPFSKILKNPETFNQSDLQTPETIYKNLLEIYINGDFDELTDKAESFRVLLSGTIVQPKYDLLMANFEGRIKGRTVWEKALKDVTLKYPDSPEAQSAHQMIHQIHLTDTIEKESKVYLNYKWIFTFCKTQRPCNNC